MSAGTADLPLVLLADDDPDDRLLLGEAFAECDRAVELIMLADGAALLERLAECARGAGARAPGLVICDINMPRMSGLEAVRALRGMEAGERTPVAMFTSSRREEDRERSLAAGADAHYVKPSSFGELVQVVDDMLGRFLPVRTEDGE